MYTAHRFQTAAEESAVLLMATVFDYVILAYNKPNYDHLVFNMEYTRLCRDGRCDHRRGLCKINVTICLQPHHFMLLLSWGIENENSYL